MRLDFCVELDLIFPINDEASARLMVTKAECLLQAGVINAAEACAVFRRAAEVAYRPVTRQAITGLPSPQPS